MTLRSEIRAALAKEPKGALMDDLFEACDSADDEGKFRGNMSVLKAEGKIKIVGTTDEEKPKALYGLADWPEDSIRGAGKRAKTTPPPRTKRAYKKRKASRARAAEPAAAPAPIANGAANFAILDSGVLTLIKHDVRVDLDAEEFTRLRKFIESTDPIWNTTQE